MDMVDRKFIEEINAAYHLLELKQAEIVYALFHQEFAIESGWYHGHYHRNGEGWERESYPIPVISVEGLCDIEVQFGRVSVSAKMKRDAALAYSFEKMMGYEFEAYGVEDYLADFYHKGQDIQALKDNIARSGEDEIGFSFSFPFEAEGKHIFDFAKLLKSEGFYY